MLDAILGVVLIMGGFGFPQMGQEEDPLLQLLAQMQQNQQAGPWDEQIPIPGGGSSTQMPQPQGSPRYQYPGPPTNIPRSGAVVQPAQSSASAPVPQIQGPYPPPQFNQGQGMMKNIGEGFRAAGMAAMPLEQQLQAQALQAEYDKANQIAQIKENDRLMAQQEHDQQLALEQARLAETQRFHEGILSRTNQTSSGGITGDPKKDAYFQLLQTPNPQTGQPYKPLEALQKLNEMNAEGKQETGAQADERWRNIGVQMQMNPESVSKADQLWYKQYERGKQIGAAPAVQVRSEMVDVMRERVEQQRRSVDLQISKATGVTPSQDIIGRAQFAQQLQPHVAELRQEVEEADKAGLLGPLMGRGVEFMEGKIGSTGDPEKDRQYAKLRQDLSLMASGMNRVHFGKNAGEHTLQYFKDQIGSSFRSKEALLGSMDSSDSYLGSYAHYSDSGGFSSPFTQGGLGPTAVKPAPKSGGDSSDGYIYAKDPKTGKLKRAPKGTPLPEGWVLQ